MIPRWHRALPLVYWRQLLISACGVVFSSLECENPYMVLFGPVLFVVVYIYIIIEREEEVIRYSGVLECGLRKLKTGQTTRTTPSIGFTSTSTYIANQKSDHRLHWATLYVE